MSSINLTDETPAKKDASTYWELERHIRSALSEGFVAEWLHSQHLDTIWDGVNNKLFDVSSVEGNRRIDAKAGFFGTFRGADGDMRDGLGFMGSSRETQAREGVTSPASSWRSVRCTND